MSCSIGIQLTTRCNLDCAHCFLDRPGDDLPLPLFERVIEGAPGLGCETIELTGGEPTCHPEFEAVIGRIAGRDLSFSLITNGQDFAGIHPVLVRHRNRLRHLAFSLEGPDAATNDRVRGKGTFDRVMQAAATCAKSELPFSIRITLTKASVPLLDAMRQTATDAGARALVLIPLLPTRRTAEAGLIPEPQDLQAVSAWALAEDERAAGVRIVLAAGFFTLNPACACASLAGRFLFVTARGEAAFCCHLADYADATDRDDILGDLRTISLADAARRARDLGRALVEQKRARQAGGELTFAEHHPCWYCLKHFRKAPWLVEYRHTFWGRDLALTEMNG